MVNRLTINPKLDLPDCEFCAGPFRYHTPECPYIARLFERPNTRDQFAMRALTGLTSNTLIAEHAAVMQIDGDMFPAWMAQRAYQYADAMIEARKTPGPSTPSGTPKETT